MEQNIIFKAENICSLFILGKATKAIFIKQGDVVSGVKEHAIAGDLVAV